MLVVVVGCARHLPLLLPRCVVYNLSCYIFHFCFWGWVLWSADDIGRSGGWCESFAVAGWGLVFLFRCSLTSCCAISVVALYFFVCWFRFFGPQGSLHFFVLSSLITLSIVSFLGYVFAFLDHRGIWCWVVLLVWFRVTCSGDLVSETS